MFSPVGGFKVGLDLLVEFEFRTTRPNGVLLVVSRQKMDGLWIEMIDDKVSGSFSQLSFHVLPVSSLLGHHNPCALLSPASCSPGCTFNVSDHTTVVPTSCGPSV